jgi:CDP-4-dehydro-6-deoxyglucose reductase
VNPNHHARLLEVRPLSPTTKHFLLEAIGEERFEFLPGQFVSLLLPIPVPDPTRSYSMASPPEGTNRFELCLNRIQGGPGSAYLFGLEPGSEVPFTGPWGTFAMRRISEAPKAFIATGTGIAPIRSQIRWLFRQGFAGEAWLLFGARNEQEILYREEWEALASENPNFRSLPTLSRPGGSWAADRGYVQVQLEKRLKGRTDMEYYLCGRGAMVNEVSGMLEGWGVEKKRIKHEKFD